MSADEFKRPKTKPCSKQLMFTLTVISEMLSEFLIRSHNKVLMRYEKQIKFLFRKIDLEL